MLRFMPSVSVIIDISLILTIFDKLQAARLKAYHFIIDP